ncbi:hypothetical protein KKC1_26670 [Calderihabitans maritimus]|uniref:Uncharacterized protein n=2 Tax=Calderihabitans maritimus TaxID=1246530 RepID=A0A1Z5HVH7_9FIRM|nr:hypothetical protein KKC1_26670 [Calderihabitans maritimus]
MVVLSFIVVLLTPFVIPATIMNHAQLSEVRLGMPFPFVQQRASLTPLGHEFPFKLRILNPLENPTRILSGNLILDVIIVYIGLWAVTQAVKKGNRFFKSLRRV